jgi:ketosteroid isomerase-like protein
MSHTAYSAAGGSARASRAMTTITESHTESIAAMYEAFGRGDIAAILSRLSADVAWDVTDEPWSLHAAGVPWAQPRRGHAGVSEFLEIVGAWRYERFEVLDMLSSETRVAAVLRIIADLPNGNRIDDVTVHLWTFGADGKVTELRRMLDTAANIAAART